MFLNFSVRQPFATSRPPQLSVERPAIVSVRYNQKQIRIQIHIQLHIQIRIQIYIQPVATRPPQLSVERPAIVWSNRSLSDHYALLNPSLPIHDICHFFSTDNILAIIFLCRDILHLINVAHLNFLSPYIYSVYPKFLDM